MMKLYTMQLKEYVVVGIMDNKDRGMTEKYYITYMHGKILCSEITDKHPVSRIQELVEEEIIEIKKFNEGELKRFEKLSDDEKEDVRNDEIWADRPLRFCADGYKLIFAIKVP